ncbi:MULTISPECIES: GTPase [Halorussus]|uniref:GTPase n=1 Tax=Halorussus TaxID=1070314 RepID=UPI0020A018E8|nr:GTPase [Halorussus vallis]USZ76079.1 50S ribosome-binding GTPase [Halorussus vallis]
MKVAVGGPPNSGKSTFTAALVEEIRERRRDSTVDLSFTWETLDVTDNSLAYLLNERERPERKHEEIEWSDQTARTKRATFEGCDEQLVVADTPGKLTEELDIVLEPADEMILLVSAEGAEEAEAWRRQAESHGIDVRWFLTTVLDEEADLGWRDDEEESEEGGEQARDGVIRSVERPAFEERGIDAYDPESARAIRRVARDLVERATRVEA